MRAVLVVAGLLMALAVTGSAAEAQQRRPREGVRTDVDERAVRAEYASVLLQSGRYAEAAAEYRALLAADSTNAQWRLELARAYAWGGQPRDAERELLIVRRTRLADDDVAALLRVVRAAIDEPPSAEAARWVAEAPAWRPYRLALARALAREGRREEAITHLDALIAQEPGPELLREVAGVYAAAADSIAAARHLGRALAMAPDDATLRLDYARALVWAGDQGGALAQYGILLERGGADGAILFERGRLHAWTGELGRAQRDLEAAVLLRPAPEAYALLGDVHRWRGAYRRARAAYDRALALAPGDSSVLAALSHLAQDERLALTAGLASATTGWVSRSTWSEDNAGFLYLATGIAHGLAVGDAGVLAFGLEQRRISHRSHADIERWITGWVADASYAHSLERVSFDARAGIARHALTGITPVSHLGISTWLSPARITASVTHAPMYAAMMSTRALVQWADGELLSAEPLEGRSVAAAASLPIRDAELWIGVERLLLSDGNERRSVAIGARYDLARRWALLYSGGQLGFERESQLYWDPRRHQAHTLGAEWSWRLGDAIGARLRAQRGIGWTSEALALADTVLTFRSRQTAQLALGGDATWRGAWWEAGAQLGWSRGRTGGYQALNGSLIVRLDLAGRGGARGHTP